MSHENWRSKWIPKPHFNYSHPLTQRFRAHTVALSVYQLIKRGWNLLSDFGDPCGSYGWLRFGCHGGGVSRTWAITYTTISRITVKFSTRTCFSKFVSITENTEIVFDAVLHFCNNLFLYSTFYFKYAT